MIYQILSLSWRNLLLIINDFCNFVEFHLEWVVRCIHQMIFTPSQMMKRAKGMGGRHRLATCQQTAMILQLLLLL